jgi:hypothetical protein
MIDFAKVREAVPAMTEDEFDDVWEHLGAALITVARAKRRYNIAVLALRNRTGGIHLVGFTGPHSERGEDGE